MKYRVLACIFVFATIGQHAAFGYPSSEYSDISDFIETPTGLEFEYQPVFASSARTVDNATDPLSMIEHIVRVDQPELSTAAYRIVAFLLPPECQSYNARITYSSSTSIDFEAISSIEELRKSVAAGGGTVDAELTADPIATIRHLKFGRVALPVARHWGERTWTIANSIRVAIDFELSPQPLTAGKSKLPSADPVYDRIITSSVINPERLRDWKQSPSMAAGFAEELDDPFAVSSEWYRIETTQEGIVELSADDFNGSGLNPASIDPRNVRIYSGPQRQLSTNNLVPLPQFMELAILFEGEDDGIWDSGDRILFYSPGVNRWEADSSGSLVHISNSYTANSVFWLTPSAQGDQPPLRIQTIDTRPVAESSLDVSSGESLAHHEINREFRSSFSGYVEDYYHWFWQTGPSVPVSFFAVRDAVIGTPATLRVVGSYSGSAGLSMAGANVSILESRDRTSVMELDTTLFQIDTFDPGASTTIQLNESAGAESHLDHFEVVYRRRLSVQQQSLKILTDLSAETQRLTIAGDTTPLVWDVTDPYRPLSFQTSPSGSGAVLEMTEPSDRHTLLAARGSQTIAASSIQQASFERLRDAGTMDQVDYLAIGPRAFASAMHGYLLWRSNNSGLTTRYVAVEDIYDQYSLGLFDPVAIQRFLKDAFERWPSPAPTYALLVGDGSYDFLNYLRVGGDNHIPPFIVEDDESVGDENYVYFGPNRILDADSNFQMTGFPDMLVGRWPVRDVADISNIIDKTQRYESAAMRGGWQSKILIVADDEFGDRNLGRVSEDIHINDAENLTHDHIPARFDVEKIYLTEYPFDAGGRYKPSCAEAIVDALNQGVLLVDYIGHGNPNLWAHERVFQRSTDLPRLNNSEFLPLIYAASCSIGFFDDPRDEGMAEAALRMPGTGAVSVVSATRLVYASQNTALNYKVFDILLNEPTTGVAEALYSAKLTRQYANGCLLNPRICINDRKYAVLGDPALQLAIPELFVNFDPLEPDSLVSLGETNVSGQIVDTLGRHVSGFSGTLSVVVRDAARERDYAINESKSLHYTLPGGTLYRGDVAIENGEFSFGFVVPKDVSYGKSQARIIVYGLDDATGATALGAYDSILVAGTSIASNDTSGPAITAFNAAGHEIAEGDKFELGEPITVRLSDPLGINLTGEPGHRIEVFVDQTETRLDDLTDRFNYLPGSARDGEVVFDLQGAIENGAHTLIVKAWDNANNSAQRSWSIIVGQYPKLSVEEFLSYPNPFAESTTFFFQSSITQADATIRLFTVSGHLIREISGAVDGLTTWDGRDRSGDAVANGVYLAQLELREADANGDNPPVRKVAKVVLAR